jgi:hypothetical protein
MLVCAQEYVFLIDGGPGLEKEPISYFSLTFAWLFCFLLLNWHGLLIDQELTLQEGLMATNREVSQISYNVMKVDSKTVMFKN